MLHDAKTLHRNNSRNNQDEHNEDSLPSRLGKQLPIDSLQKAYCYPGAAHHTEYSGNPERDSYKKTPEVAKRLLCPVVKRTFIEKHRSQLRGNNKTRHKENQRADDPVSERGKSRSSRLNRIVDEKDHH